MDYIRSCRFSSIDVLDHLEHDFPPERLLCSIDYANLTARCFKRGPFRGRLSTSLGTIAANL